MNLESVIQSIVNQKEKKTNINAYIFHVSKVLLKILHARLQHYMNHQYVKMNFQYVAACAVLLVLFALILYGAAFLIMKRKRLA